MDKKICYSSAVEAIERFEAKTLSPVELLQALIDRAEKIESHVNAFTYEYYDEALDAAREAEQRYAAGNPRPLEGVPIAVKDEFMIKGKITSNGSLFLKDFVAETTSPIIQRLLDAGAIVHARTATPEFSISATTFSKLWGVTRNPWNPEFTCGGSSGGAGASLAAGTTTLATGSDIGGSIRIPSSLNGVIGFKAPYGRNPEEPPFNLEYYNHPGAMARTVGDCILMQNIISGPHPLDIATVKPKLVIPSTLDDIKGWRIAYSIDLGYHEVDPDVRKNTLAAVEVFRSLGATVEEVGFGWTEKTLKAAMDHLSYSVMGAYVLEYYHQDKDKLTDYACRFAELVQSVNIMDAFEAEMVAGEMWSQFSPVFDRYNLFICPTVAGKGVAADLDYSKDKVEINGKHVDPMLGWVMTYPFNILSRCPVLSIPTGKASNNLPTGMQLVGPTYEDITVFQAASAFESAAGPFFSASNYPEIS
jgi:Asp-tRNA(Asn)/Glu-tRNA(Gln) amidotransferase A subunit family amidase